MIFLAIAVVGALGLFVRLAYDQHPHLCPECHRVLVPRSEGKRCQECIMKEMGAYK